MSVEVEYREIPGCPGYRAGSDGSIWSCWKAHRLGYARGAVQIMSDKWKRLAPDRRKEDGRKRYTIKTKSGKYRRSYGSHLVLESFIGPRPDGMEACHGDGNCLNDSMGNLRWDTSVANKDDMRKHGTRLNGELINTSKLTADDVLEIRCIGYPLRQHAERFGVTETLVSLIIRRKVWKHV